MHVISLNQKQESKVAHEELFEGKLIETSTNTSHEESEVEFEEESIEAPKGESREGHANHK